MQAGIPCLYNRIGHFLLGDGCADLHGSTGLGIALDAHLTRREGGAVNTVASCASTQHNDTVTGLYSAGMTAVWPYCPAATEGKGVVKVNWMVENCSLHRRDTHFIAYVAHTG